MDQPFLKNSQDERIQIRINLGGSNGAPSTDGKMVSPRQSDFTISEGNANLLQPQTRERPVTLYDVQKILGVDPNSKDINEFANVNKHIQTQLDAYNGPNPFVQTLPFTNYEKFKIVFFSLTGILFVKIILVVLILLWCFLMSLGVTLGNDEIMGAKRKPIPARKGLPCCRKLFVYGIRFGARMLLFVFGFYWMPVSDDNKLYKSNTIQNKIKARIITPNHCAVVDPFIIFYLFGMCYIYAFTIYNLQNKTR